MWWPFRWLAWAFVQALVWMRYRVTVRGLDAVAGKPGPYLVLPNHPAYTDPACVLAALWPRFKVRPMILETNFRNPILAPYGFLLRAIRIPDTDKPSAAVRQQAEAAIAEAAAALKAGDNVLLYPSGRLERDAWEHLGGSRAASDLLAAAPNATVLLVRTRGLWGSMFGWAYATKPPLLWRMATAAGIFISNLFLFTPRRRVTMTVEAFATADRPEPTRDTLNRWLEAWYNAEGREEPKYVPYHFLFGRKSVEYPPPVAAPRLDLGNVKPATRAAVAEMLGEKLKRPLAESENRAETAFMDLGLDSLEGAELGLAVEQRFGFTAETVPATVGQLWALAEGLVDKGPPKPPPAGWFAPPGDTGPAEVLGETLAAAFVNRALKSRRDVAAADDLAGVITYEKLLLGAWAMSKRFRDIPAPNVGLLLPAAVAADLALLGLQLAGKLPVAINWTTGPANIAHAVKVMGLTHVVTSKAFVDRTGLEVPGTQFVFLEDVKAGIGKLELLPRLLAVRFAPGWVRGRLLGRLDPDPQKPMVVLFTSGSEKAPKAVPLTHANLVADAKAGVPHLLFSRSDVMLGFLPLFHSFGLNVCGLLPLISGMKVVHHPDPTDASALARKAAAYHVTLLMGTPTFVGYILERCKPGDLPHLRAIVTGAEKCPDAIFEKAKEIAPQADVLEGYGITECSPVVAVNRPGAARRGTIGQPLPGVELLVLDLETNEPQPQGKSGMLHVAGPIVFPGYLGHDGPQPFVERDGKRWYVTGDLGALDEAGAIVFHGRLKRFLKAGGEMISLPALEEPFARQFPPTDKGPRVAVEGVETPAGRTVVLFTTEPVTLKDANATLQKEGFRGVMRLDDVRAVDAIPVLGTGKTDYKVLRAMLAGK